MATGGMVSTGSGDDFPGADGMSRDSFSSNDSEFGWETQSDDENPLENILRRKDVDAVSSGPSASSGTTSMTAEPTLSGLRKGFLLLPNPKKKETAVDGGQCTGPNGDSSNSDGDRRKQLLSDVSAKAAARPTDYSPKKQPTAESADKSSPTTQRKKCDSSPIDSETAAAATTAASVRRTSGSTESEPPVEEWPCNFGECDVRQPITSADNYFQISCLSDCMLRVHPECFKRALAKQNIDTRKKKNIKNPSCITPDCGAAMFEIYEHHINRETTLYKRCCEAPPAPSIDKKPEAAKRQPVLKLPKDFFASMKGANSDVNKDVSKDVDNKPAFQPVFDMRPVEPKKTEEPKVDTVVPTPPPNIVAVPLKREEDIDLKYKIAEDGVSKKKSKKQRDKHKAQLLPTEFTFASDNNRLQLNYGSSMEFVGGGGGAAYDGRLRMDDYRRPSETYSNDDDDFGLPVMNVVAGPVMVTAPPRQPAESPAVVARRPDAPDIADRAVLSHMRGEVDRILPEIRPILAEIASELCIMGVPISIEEVSEMIRSRTSQLWLGDRQTVAEIVNSGYTDMLVTRSHLFRFDPQNNLVSALENLSRSPSSSAADGDSESGIGDDDDSSKAVSANQRAFSSKQALDDVLGGAFKTAAIPSIVEVRTVTTESGNGRVDASRPADESSVSDNDDNTQVDLNEQLLATTARLEEDLITERDRMTQMKRQHKVELDAIMNDNASLEAKITELNERLTAARNKERDQMKKIAALEKEFKELKERMSRMASEGTDLDELKSQNEDLREQLRAVELSHNENDRTHRAIVAQFSNRAEHAETALLTIKCEVESRSLQRKLGDAEHNVGHTQLIVDRIRAQGAPSGDLVAWMTYNHEWKRIAAAIRASIEDIKGKYSRMIEEINSGRKTLNDFTPVQIPGTPPPPPMPPLPFNPRDMQQSSSSVVPFPNNPLRPVVSTPPGLERQHFVQRDHESNLAPSPSQPPKESLGAVGGAAAGGGGRDKLQKLIAEVRRKLPEADEKTITSAMGKLRRDKWNGSLPKNMRNIITEVVQYLTEASQTERTTAWVTAQAAASVPRDARAILAGGHECKICLMSCLSDQDLSACSACNEPYHRPCVNQWLQQSTGTGDCPNCRKPWLSPEDFPSLQ